MQSKQSRCSFLLNHPQFIAKLKVVPNCKELYALNLVFLPLLPLLYTLLSTGTVPVAPVPRITVHQLEPLVTLDGCSPRTNAIMILLLIRV